MSQEANLNFPGNIAGVEALVATGSPQEVTGSWANLGNEVSIAGARVLTLYYGLDINDAENVRFRLMVRLDGDSQLHELPTKAVSATSVQVTPQVIEVADDIDQYRVVDWSLASSVYAGQIQVQAGTVGATPAQILRAFATAGN